MLMVVVNLCWIFMLNYWIFLVIGKLDSNKFVIPNKYGALLIAILSIVQTIMYNTNYNTIYILFNFVSTILFNKILFKNNMPKTVISTCIAYLLLMFCDILVSVLLINFVSLTILRSTWYYRFICNFIVLLIYIVMFNIPPIQRKIKFFFNKTSKNNLSIIIFFILLILSIVTITYDISVAFGFNFVYISSFLIIITLVSLCFIFINDTNEYNKLNEEYESLFSYIQAFEDWIEKEQLTRHEYKNQLAVLRNLTKEKKVKEKIDSIVDDFINIDNRMVTQLKNLPNGGLKGLLYYKISTSKKQKVNITIDIDDSVGDELSKINDDKLKTLTKLLGIYVDNAIEASLDTKKKIVNIEIYKLKENIKIVISNTFNKDKDISNRNMKGVSTKGKGRGNGLYFAGKLISMNKWIEDKQEIIDKFYIQSLIIKNKKV